LGQVTDDSELALCLADGLINGNGKLHLDMIAKVYDEWINSHPFDIGTTPQMHFQERQINILT
jgi:ADP-ribosylglycohydrolase